MRLLHLSKEDLNGPREYVYFTDEDGHGKTDELEEDYPELQLDWEVEILEVDALPALDELYKKRK